VTFTLTFLSELCACGVIFAPDCDGSDLVLCTVECGLHVQVMFLHVFDSAQQLISSGRCTIIFIIACNPLSCYAIGLQLDTSSSFKHARSRCVWAEVQG